MPAKTGPVPSTNGVMAGIRSGGISTMMAKPSTATVPTFTNAER